MAGYIVARINVTDWVPYQEYAKATPEVIAQYGGKFIIRGGETVTLEGPHETDRLVVIEFPTVQRAKDFYNSPEYQAAKRLRVGAATAQFIAVEGTE